MAVNDGGLITTLLLRFAWSFARASDRAAGPRWVARARDSWRRYPT
jgi:hypothetical protein